MKRNLLLTTALGLLVLAGTAQAQTWGKWDGSGDFKLLSAQLTSASAVTAAPVANTSAKLDILLKGSTTVTSTISYKLKNGAVVTTSTVAAGTTPVLVSNPAPLSFQSVTISPSSALGTATLDVNLIQSK